MNEAQRQHEADQEFARNEWDNYAVQAMVERDEREAMYQAWCRVNKLDPEAAETMIRYEVWKGWTPEERECV